MNFVLKSSPMASTTLKTSRNPLEVVLERKAVEFQWKNETFPKEKPKIPIIFLYSFFRIYMPWGISNQEPFFFARTFGLTSSSAWYASTQISLYYHMFILGIPYQQKSVQLKCVVECDPLCDILWHRNSAPLPITQKRRLTGNSIGIEGTGSFDSFSKYTVRTTQQTPNQPENILQHVESTLTLVGWLSHNWYRTVSKVDCSVENLTCVGKTSGFWISRRFFSVCCESCLNSVDATAATTQNGTS
jgi:hypothetical protein